MTDQAQPCSWVCDGCMARVEAHDVAEWADYEHVLCRSCWRRGKGEA